MAVNPKEDNDPIGFGKKKKAMPTVAELEKSLKGFDEKEEKEDEPRCPCPYWLHDQHVFVQSTLGTVIGNSKLSLRNLNFFFHFFLFDLLHVTLIFFFNFW